MRRLLRLAFLLCLLPALAFAQGRYVPEGLSADELKALEIQGLRDPGLVFWERLRLYEIATENFRRAGLLTRCGAITGAGPDDFYFDPALRAALDGVVDKMLAGKIIPVTLQDFRYYARLVLWAQRHASPADWQAALRLAQTPAGRRALQHQHALAIIDTFNDHVTDINTGKRLAYAPIALKTYFTRSGDLAAFDRALQSVNPELRTAFARVRALQDHGTADFPWLRELSEALEDHMPAIQKAFLDQLPAEDRRALDEMNAAPFFRLYADASEAAAFPPATLFLLIPGVAEKIDSPKFRGMTFGNRDQPGYTDFVRASLASEYPQSAEQIRALSMGPRQFIDDAHLPFCPPAKP